MKKKLINLAEILLTESHKKFEKEGKKFDGLSFIEIWEKISKDSSLEKNQRDDGIADFYNEMIQDPKFVNIGNNKWRLKEFISFEEYKKIKGAMYGIENLERIEEENRTKELNLESKPTKEIEIMDEDVLDAFNQKND